MSGVFDSLDVASGALNAYSSGIQITAHNIANVSTPDFVPVRAVYATGPGDRGVRLDAILNASDGSAGNENRAMADQHIKRPSGTELAQEFTLMIRDQRAFEANATTISTLDATIGTLLDTST